MGIKSDSASSAVTRRGDGGVLLGAVLAGPAARPALERLAGAWGERLRAAYEALQTAPAEVRRAVVQRLTSALLSPLPDGYEQLDAGRLQLSLERAHPQVAAAVVSVLPPPLPASLEPFARVPCRLPVALRLRVARQQLEQQLEASEDRRA